MKIIRNIEKYREAAKIEIEILKQIRDAGGCQVSYDYQSRMIKILISLLYLLLI